MNKTNAQAVADHGEKQKQKGLRRVYVWAYPELNKDIREYVKARNRMVERERGE